MKFSKLSLFLFVFLAHPSFSQTLPAELSGKWTPEKCLTLGSSGIKVVYDFDNTNKTFTSISSIFDDLDCKYGERNLGEGQGTY